MSSKTPSPVLLTILLSLKPEISPRMIHAIIDITGFLSILAGSFRGSLLTGGDAVFALLGRELFTHLIQSLSIAELACRLEEVAFLFLDVMLEQFLEDPTARRPLVRFEALRIRKVLDQAIDDLVLRRAFERLILAFRG